MTRRRVLLMGQSSIFATGVQKILEQAENIEIAGVMPTLLREEIHIKKFHPDVVVLASADDPETFELLLAHLLKTYPALPVIVANLAEESLYVYTSQRVGTCSSDLLAAIAALPSQSPV